jgi:hypothetical protein
VSIDIEAEDAKGFSESVVRAARENGVQLKMTQSGFE